MTIDKELENNIISAGQGHVLQYWNELDESSREQLAGQLEKINFAELARLIPEYVTSRPKTVIPDDLAPAPYFPMTPETQEQKELYARAYERGIELLKAGKVCFLTVAGGQGTRLGFDGPKGTYPIGPVTGRTLFAYFAQNILRAGQKYKVKFSWYIMTSLLNNEATTRFFAENNYFGLDKEQVFFFTQGTMPAIGYDGKLLLGAKDSLSLSPDGHGGTLLALRKSGALKRMEDEGTNIISYFQVDNPLIKMTNPLFIGLHDLENAEMSAVMLAKTNAYEKLGNFCVSNGRLNIIEYSDLPKELAEKTDASGKLCYIAGSPAIHLISRDFVARLTSGGELKLPWHRADKKIPFIDANGNPATPAEPNGVKLESFIFDALPLAGRTMVLECDRNEVFAPTKNPTGVDSVESCRAMLIERDAKRLEKAGVCVARKADGSVDALIEISPALILDEEDAAKYVKDNNITCVKAGETLVIG